MTTPDPGLIDLVTKALHAAQRGVLARPYDLQEAADHVLAVFEQYGPDGMDVLLIALCDTTIDALTQGAQTDGQIFGVAWRNVADGQINTADDVDPAIRWAGRLIAARANDDPEMWCALVNTVPDDSRVQSDHVMHLVEIAALTVNASMARRQN